MRIPCAHEILSPSYKKMLPRPKITYYALRFLNHIMLTKAEAPKSPSRSATWSCYPLYIDVKNSRRKGKNEPPSFSPDTMDLTKSLTHIPRRQITPSNSPIPLTPIPHIPPPS